MIFRFPCTIHNSPFSFSSSEIFTIINATQLRFLKSFVILIVDLDVFFTNGRGYANQFNSMAQNKGLFYLVICKSNYNCCPPLCEGLTVFRFLLPNSNVLNSTLNKDTVCILELKLADIQKKRHDSI